MNIDIMKLRQNIVDSIKIEETLKFDNEALKLANIIDTKNLIIRGYISKYEVDDYYLDLLLESNLILPSSIDLKPVKIEINAEISGNYNEMMEEIGEFSKKNNNSLDILPIIWENMLMEIPIKVTGPEATDLKLSGDGWKLVTEESDNKEEAVSPFDKLKNLL